MDVYISKLRDKLPEISEYIKTIKGVGYKLEERDSNINYDINIEGIFIGINSKILSNLYQERAKQILKEDTILVKLVAEGNPRTKYQELFSNNCFKIYFSWFNREVVFDSKKTEEEEKRMDNHLQREEIQEAIEKKESFTIRYKWNFWHCDGLLCSFYKNSVGKNIY